MNESWQRLLGEFAAKAPSPAESISLLEAFFAKFGKRLPPDLREFLEFSDGAEGFVGEQYLMLWGAKEIVEFNKSYMVDKYAPGLLLFGSNGGGEAHAFDLRNANAMPVVKVPFTGMDLQYADVEASTFIEFLEMLGIKMSSQSGKDNMKHLLGLEIFEIQPVILGGSPTDPGNKAFLNRHQHIEAVCYWNKVIKDLR